MQSTYRQSPAPQLCLFLLAAWTASAAVPGELLRQFLENRPPNIVLVVAEDLGYGDLGCYGQKKILTPHIDRLAREGMRFTQCYAGSSLSVPSRAALLTGKQPRHVGLRGIPNASLDPSKVNLATFLRKLGYQTGIIGHWGMGTNRTAGTPHHQGFDEWLGYLGFTNAANAFPRFLWRTSVTNSQFDVLLPLEQNFDGKQDLFAHNLFTQAATNFVRISRYQPFFLYLPLTLPGGNATLASMTGNGMEVPDDSPYSDRPWPQPEKNKAARITRLDDTVGRIMGIVERYHLQTNTVFIVTSSNGPHKKAGCDPAFFRSTGLFRGSKGSLLEGGLRVPMIVRWPQRVKAGSVSHQDWAFWDLFPTIADILDHSPPEALDGVSILPTLLGKKQEQRHDHYVWTTYQPVPQEAVRWQHWKAIRRGPGNPWELYDLKRDPGEFRNRASRHPDVLQRVKAILDGKAEGGGQIEDGTR